MEGDLSLFQTIVIAIVEGLTEFLPVSSTGHMIITQHILGVESTDFVKAFTFIIQFGAILSVVCLYWKNFFHLNHTPMPENCTPVKRFLHKYDFYWKLLVAFIPAAVLGLLFSDMIDAMLESVTVVAVMLIAGGIFMLFCDKIFGNGSEKTVLTEKRALPERKQQNSLFFWLCPPCLQLQCIKWPNYSWMEEQKSYRRI